MATSTLSPYPKFYAWDTTTGDPLAGGLVYTVSAGGSFPADAIATYTDQAGLVANANPIVLNSAGYCVIYLTPGLSYKFIVNAAANPAPAVPNDIIWTADGIDAVPTTSPAVDVSGTAGENLAAEDIVYISDGSGGKVAGSWYKADADFGYASSTTGQTGIALAAITSGDTGSIRTIGQVDYASSLTPGAKYYVSATAGALTATAPVNQRYVGVADSVNSIVLGPGPIPSFPVDNAICDGRLTLTTAVPVTIADVTASTSIFFTPYKGNRIALYDGTTWNLCLFTEITIPLGTLTSGAIYDVFLYNNNGTPAYELSIAWSSATAGASAIFGSGTYQTTRPTQDGVYVKSTNGTAIDATRRYIGTFKTISTTQTAAMYGKRFLWNYYNRVDLGLLWQEVTASWTYSTATWRQVRATATNQVEFVIGVAEVLVHFDVAHLASPSGSSVGVGTAVGLDSTTTPMTTMVGGVAENTVGGTVSEINGTGEAYPAVGYHYAAWLESSATFATTTWYGLSGSIPNTPGSGVNPGIRGRLLG